MAVLIGLTGKPSSGKSTFFSAATMVPVEIATYPFTTIKPNRGIAYVRSRCPHLDLGKPCTPHNAPCDNGVRLVPLELLDVAGLVPDAHKGKGLGNQFLDDLRQAAAFIQIVDASGGTDNEGNAVPLGSHDPQQDVVFLERELALWLGEVATRDWDKWARRVSVGATDPDRVMAEKLQGLGFREGQVMAALKEAPVVLTARRWSDEELYLLGRSLMRHGKPSIIAANKADIAPEALLKALLGLEGRRVVATSADYELALRRAAKAGLIDYVPGASSFTVLQPGKLTPAQAKALERMLAYLRARGGTGVQACLEELAYKVLNYIVVYPVEDETHWIDKQDRVLPDAHLLPRGSNARDLAYRVHSDLGDNFIRAINGRTKRVVGHDYELQDGDVIKIVAR